MWMPNTGGSVGAAVVPQFGSSIAFSSGDVLASTTDLTDVGTGDFTWEAWFRPSVWNDAMRAIFGLGPTDDGRILLRGFQPGADALTFNVSAFVDFGITLSYSGITTATWHHAAIARNGSTVRCFVNGEVRASITDGNSIVTGPLVLASSESDASVDPFAGKIALARFSDVARYTSNFTPDKEYGVDANTEALIGSFDGGATISDAAGNYTLTAVAGSPAADSEGIS